MLPGWYRRCWGGEEFADEQLTHALTNTHTHGVICCASRMGNEINGASSAARRVTQPGDTQGARGHSWHCSASLDGVEPPLLPPPEAATAALRTSFLYFSFSPFFPLSPLLSSHLSSSSSLPLPFSLSFLLFPHLFFSSIPSFFLLFSLFFPSIFPSSFLLSFPSPFPSHPSPFPSPPHL